ncbi:MAG TPA: hypothetical protein VNU72_10375, partial [Puia sp.]|nr:hypothetical protein [Puia sp.]
MNKQISSLLIKICILIGAFFLGLAARSHAQTTSPGGNRTDSTHHRYGMHRGWDKRSGGDSLARHFHRDGQNGFRGGGAFRGRDGFHGRDRFRDAHARRDGWAIHYTPQQRQQVMAINKDYRQKAADLFKQDNITLKQYKAGLVALQKDKKDKLSALLTQEQKDQQAAQRKRMSENRQVREVANMERLKLRLNLTDDQVAKLKSGQENLRSQAKAIHENDNLLPQEKMQQMKALMAKRNDTYKSVLTPDQYSQFEKMFHHRQGGFGRPGRHFDGPAGPGGPGT